MGDDALGEILAAVSGEQRPKAARLFVSDIVMQELRAKGATIDTTAAFWTVPVAELFWGIPVTVSDVMDGWSLVDEQGNVLAAGGVPGATGESDG